VMSKNGQEGSQEQTEREARAAYRILIGIKSHRNSERSGRIIIRVLHMLGR
jgi:hypothetical protein